MGAPSISFNGIRINASDSSTGWSNWGATGPSPAAEAQLGYQNSLAVNKKVNSNSLGGLQFATGTGADLTSASNPLWFVKVIVADSFDLNTTEGVRVAIGNSNSNYYHYNVSGSTSNNSSYGQYPPQGGYLITAINPNIVAWRGGTVGTVTLTNILWYGAQAAFINGLAKAENVALDAIDIGTGLTVVDGVGAAGDFLDFITYDQDTIVNRYGVVTGSGSQVTAHCLLTIGAVGTATEFFDDSSIVIFPDGYHSEGLVGVSCDIQNAGSDIVIGTLMIGQGTIQANPTDDTRPDFSVVGTSGTFEFYGTLRNFNNVTFTSVCDVHDAIIRCFDLNQNSAHIYNSILRTNSTANVATINDPTFGLTSGLHDLEFEQYGTGHAIEITTPGTYTLNSIFFGGYGAIASGDAAIYNNSGGSVTINVSGGNTPTYRNGAGASTIVQNSVSVSIDTVETDGSIEDGVKVLLFVNEAGGYPYQESISISSTGTVATVTHTGHGLSDNNYVMIRGADVFGQVNGIHQITVTDANTYTYTLASATGGGAESGTITSTFVVLYGTSAGGNVSGSIPYISPQAVSGRARKSTGGPYFKSSPIVGTLTSTGFTSTVTMVRDE